MRILGLLRCGADFLAEFLRSNSSGLDAGGKNELKYFTFIRRGLFARRNRRFPVRLSRGISSGARNVFTAEKKT